MVIRNEKLAEFLKPGKQVHLIGIGGVSMRPLALVLKDRGIHVTGSDMNASGSTAELEAHGIHVAIGHRAENIAGAACIIRTAAVHNDNPEIAAARALGIPVFERAQAWGMLMREYRNAICVSGTHGKTTTTSMVTHVMMAAQADPTVMIGGALPLLGAGHRVGSGDAIILESCEYCDSFLNFYPTLAIILNIEADHLDYFEDLADVQKSFRAFAELATHGVLANGDDENTVDTLRGMNYISFGLGKRNRIQARNISADWSEFDVYCDDVLYTHLKLAVFGRHNTLNALAAAGAGWMLGVDGAVVAEGLATFTGAGRRMERKGSYKGIPVYDDYAHHPGELAALIDSLKTKDYGRIVVAFQPHTYTRTNALFKEFVRELRRVDVCVLAEIYAARERNDLGISSQDLAARIPGSVYCETLPEVTEYLRQNVREGDIVLTVGAGDIYRAGEALVKG